MTLVAYIEELKINWEAKEKALKKFAEWTKKTAKVELIFSVDRNIYQDGKVLFDEPNDEEKEWLRHRMSGPTWTWKEWDA